MQDEIKVSEGYQPTHQFISFVEGSSSEAPDISSYPLQVLGADHNLNFIDGGDPTEGFSPWVTDILVYPSSEYWETKLDGDKVRPYFDLSISNYNTLRIPSAIHNYNLYVDDARVYGDLTIDGETNLNGQIQVTGVVRSDTLSINSGEFTVSEQGVVEAASYKGVSNMSANIVEKTTSFTFSETDTGSIFHCDPSTSDLSITLPGSATNGTVFTVINVSSVLNVVIPSLNNARGNILSERFSTATIYYMNGWYGFGDLV